MVKLPGQTSTRGICVFNRAQKRFPTAVEPHLERGRAVRSGVVFVYPARGGFFRLGHVVSPVSRYVLQERSLQPEVIDPHEGVWTISFDYRFEAQTPPDSTGTLWMNSELTLLNPGVKFVRIFIFFLDADGRVLERATFLRISSFPDNPVVTHHQYTTPPGTAAVAFVGRTRGNIRS